MHKEYKLTNAQRILKMNGLLSLHPRKDSLQNVMRICFRVSHDADIHAMEIAFNRLIAENDSLRIRIIKRGLKSLQYIDDFEYKSLPIIYVESDEQREQSIREYNADYWINTTDRALALGKLVVFGDDVTLVINVSHLVTDGYSTRLIFEQLEQSYDEACVDGTMKICPTRNGSIAEYFDAEQKYLKSEQFKKDQRYWRKIFFHQPHYSIPGGYRAADRVMKYITLELDDENVAKLRSCTGALHINMRSLMMSAAACTTYILSGKDNFALFFANHGRTTRSLQQTIGNMFSNVPMMYLIDENASIADNFKKDFRKYLESFSHARMPLTKIIPYAIPEGTKNLGKYNNSWLIFSNMERGSYAELSKYDFSVIEKDETSIQLYLACFEISDSRIVLELKYQSKKYTEQQIERMKQAFTFVLEKLCDNPELTPAQLKTVFLSRNE